MNKSEYVGVNATPSFVVELLTSEETHCVKMKSKYSFAIAQVSKSSAEMTNNSAVIVAMLEMSLLGDGSFTQHPSHSSVPRIKTCV